MMKSNSPKSASRQSLHKYVIGGIGIWLLFILSFPIAYWRVSQTHTFQDVPFKPLRPHDTQKPMESY